MRNARGPRVLNSVEWHCQGCRHARTPRASIASESFQVRAYFHGALVTQFAILFERLVNDFLALRRNIRVDPHRRYGWARQNGVEDHSRGVASERKLPSRHLIQNCAEGK